MNVLFAILIIFLVGYACFWFIERAQVPYPASMILKVIIGFLCIVAMLVKAGVISGAGLGL